MAKYSLLLIAVFSYYFFIGCGKSRSPLLYSDDVATECKLSLEDRYFDPKKPSGKFDDACLEEINVRRCEARQGDSLAAIGEIEKKLEQTKDQGQRELLKDLIASKYHGYNSKVQSCKNARR